MENRNQNHEAIFTQTSLRNCLKCEKPYFSFKNRIAHVLKHVSTDTDYKIYSCKSCDFGTHLLSIIMTHAKKHIEKKKKKSDPEEIQKYFENEMMMNEKVICEMGIACFGSPMEVVEVQPNIRSTRCQQYDVDERAVTDDGHEQDYGNVQDPVPIEDIETAEPQRLQMLEPTPERVMLLPTIKDEENYQQLSQILSSVVLGRNVKNEHDPIHLDDDYLDEDRQNMELEVVLQNQKMKHEGLVPVPLAASTNPEIFNNYRLQKEWDTDELIVNMRTVGEMLKFSRNVIDMAMNVLKENAMDGASMSYQAENLTEFFKLCPVVIGVRTAITKILQTMGQKEFNG